MKTYKKITKILVLSLTCIVPSIAAAQKIQTTNIDKFTNDTTRLTTQEKIASTEKFTSSVAEFLNVVVGSDNKDIFVGFEIDLTTADHNRFLIPENNHVLIKLADNTIISLTNPISARAERRGIASGLFVAREYWTVKIPCSIDKSEVDKIMASTVTNIRAEAENQNIDFDIKPKDAEIFKKMFQLILNANKSN